jgi:hypothetical protein
VSIRVGLDEPVRRGVLHRREHDSGAGGALSMQTQHGVHVHGRHDIAVEDNERVRYPLGRVPNRAAGAERRRLDNVAQPYACALAIPEHLLDTPRLVVQAQNDLINFRHLAQKVNLVVQKRPIEDGHDRLRRMNRQRAEARPLAAGKQNGLHDNRLCYFD